jgi:PadR family transcriptional regulator PadR
MGRKETMTFATVSVLKAIAGGSRYGFDIMDATGLPSGTVYPILGRLDDNGLARSRWEDQRIAHGRKRPPRRYYEVTSEGKKTLDKELKKLRALAEPSSTEGVGAEAAEAKGSA